MRPIKSSHDATDESTSVFCHVAVSPAVNMEESLCFLLVVVLCVIGHRFIQSTMERRKVVSLVSL